MNRYFITIGIIFFAIAHINTSCEDKIKWSWLCCCQRPQKHIFLKNCFRNSAFGSAYVTYKLYEDAQVSNINFTRIGVLSSITGGAVLVMSLKETYYDTKL